MFNSDRSEKPQVKGVSKSLGGGGYSEVEGGRGIPLMHARSIFSVFNKRSAKVCQIVDRANIAAPGDLRAQGQRLWADVVGSYVLDPAEVLLLHELCRTADELDVLQAAMAGAEPVVGGSQGQPRPHPLLAEIREHRKVADRLALALALPNLNVGETVGARRSPGARKAANARWGRKGA